ncbi:hypothetical protein [Mycolicibacterium rutilum]|uniref:hypothetical protein n=1 Tax=Mycolicibacterium rutilum TaxID=370526 RepID=UPI0012FF9513|nr:hypothetical protein [Mycolicibacterium rutilum]
MAEVWHSRMDMPSHFGIDSIRAECSANNFPTGAQIFEMPAGRSITGNALIVRYDDNSVARTEHSLYTATGKSPAGEE